ncbi:MULTISPECIES: GNAT family N-acetyltransferase [Streptomyces]|uniref:GNAT family N-acetyltransferase n=1 Tax=Streptomyces caniscabiei TaxID=2746961 RepID=A0ABU4N145_9ACTN|nr:MULTISPECIES: GNAT family N-acetyltransferase [Streptomyces]MBE4741651.1 GNAT family N-acetyltransferase [Streptomyces caniscabiei]MBE4761927.1 GNAT family N-acetyltransferase [Streptomyces caniscabiei]MBE4775299.1 GNAT family N-acetyltransferase [Streptomyces caniscabiei]MBE4790427.1 GNAT family N-acetyltransferase [Streptomyces caniscabiei]MBE4799582.1 GNAT family N-acetyltransferase [Streptomyces caniscabiei]
MTWTIERVEGAALDLDEVLEVYRSSGLGERRPADDRERMAAMVRNANLVLIARESDGTLVGIARSVSDFSYVTYLSDIAVSGTHQRSGIGRALIDATRKEAPTAKIVLLSAPAATEYYPHLGFTAHNSAWVLNP